MKKNKRILIITLVAVIVLLTAFASKTFGIEGFLTKIGRKYAEVKSNDKVVATVDNKPIYLSMVTLYYLTAKKCMRWNSQSLRRSIRITTNNF